MLYPTFSLFYVIGIIVASISLHRTLQHSINVLSKDMSNIHKQISNEINYYSKETK